MKKKILILAGGISKERLISLDTGLQVAKELKKNGYKVKISEPDGSLPKNIYQFKPDVIFGLAAMVSRVTCEQAGTLAVATNMTGLQNMIELAKTADAKFVYFSTSEVYGPNLDIMDEITTIPRPNNRYGLTKLLGESLVEHDVKYHSLKACSLRPFMMYDEDEDLGDHRSAMIRFATNLALGKSIEVHEGSARGWFHVSDAVRAVEAAAHHCDEYGIYNIGHPEIHTIAEMAEMIRKELDADPSLVNVVKIPGQMTAVKNPSLSRMQNILGVKPQVSLEEGIKLVCSKIRERIAANPNFS